MDDGSKTRLITESSGSDFQSATDSEIGFSDSRGPSDWTPSGTDDETDDDPETIMINDNFESKRGSRLYSFAKGKNGKERLVCQKPKRRTESDTIDRKARPSRMKVENGDIPSKAPTPWLTHPSMEKLDAENNGNDKEPDKKEEMAEDPEIQKEPITEKDLKAAKDAKRNAICITGLNLAIAAQNVEQLIKLIIRRKLCKKVCTNEKNDKWKCKEDMEDECMMWAVNIEIGLLTASLAMQIMLSLNMAFNKHEKALLISTFLSTCIALLNIFISGFPY